MPDKLKTAETRRFLRIIPQLLVDAVLVNIAMLLALYLRYDMHVPSYQMARYIHVLPVYTALSLLSFLLMRLYGGLWQYASIDDGVGIIIGTLLACGSTYAFSLIAFSIQRTPNLFLLTRPVYAITWLLMLILVGGWRFGARLTSRIGVRRRVSGRDGRRVMIIGAGWAGSSTIRELVAKGYRDGTPIVVVDDDPTKTGKHIGRVRVVYGVVNVPEYAKRYKIDEIIIAVPSASKTQMKAIMDACTETSCLLKMVPSMRDMTGAEKTGPVRNVNIADLLFRDEVHLDMASISGYLEDRTVLVTGGGGSIGSELCRQIAVFKPKHLIIFDIYENNAYELCTQLKASYPELKTSLLIGSIRDCARLDAVFAACRPDVVFHAAAHKHVPAMEDSPAEAIKNNIFGTLNVVRCADKYGVKRFVTLSTDKAVNPTNVMGATKRGTEMIIQYMARRSKTTFMAVRFGNVLGSNGSVIPLFREQIERGGPLTVTHPDITRYFMTIPEAAQLVLQAGAIGQGGNIFVLNMGTPVRIVDLARNLIRLSGYTPDVDMQIKFTGLRPGEKMYEELVMAEEKDTVTRTHHEKIMIVHPSPFDDSHFEKSMETLRQAVERDPSHVRDALKQFVVTYKP